MSKSMPHLDTLGSAECSSLDFATPDRCTDCQLRGYKNCARCRSALTQQIRCCSTTNKENGRSSSVQRSKSTITPSKTNTGRRQSRVRSSSNDRSLDKTDVGVGKRRKASKSLDRSASFFSLSSIRRKSFGLKGNTTRKANKEQRKMYAKRMKKLRADKQVALTGEFKIFNKKMVISSPKQDIETLTHMKCFKITSYPNIINKRDSIRLK